MGLAKLEREGLWKGQQKDGRCQNDGHRGTWPLLNPHKNLGQADLSGSRDLKGSLATVRAATIFLYL